MLFKQTEAALFVPIFPLRCYSSRQITLSTPLKASNATDKARLGRCCFSATARRGERHALPNALLPVITLSGVLLGLVLAGSVPVERAFATPGLGFAMFIAVSERDVFVMQNLVFLYAAVFVLLNIVVDVTIALLDPRIRLR